MYDHFIKEGLAVLLDVSDVLNDIRHILQDYYTLVGSDIVYVAFPLYYTFTHGVDVTFTNTFD